MPRGVKKKSTKAKAKKVTHLVLTSSCGQFSQASYYASASSSDEAKTKAAKAASVSDYYSRPKAIYIVKVEEIGKTTSEIVWS